MGQPLVSIVVISYNQSQYIRQNLDSLISQTYSNWELIVADDASTDNSSEEFENWLTENKVNAQKIFHTANTGLATVLNEAITICSGKYVKLIAADDFLHPESIEICVNKLEVTDENCAMVFTDFFAVNDKGENTDFHINYTKENFVDANGFLKQEQLIKYNCIIAPSVLIKKQAILATGKYNSSMILEDHHRWLMINEKMKIAYVTEKLVYYRIVATSVSETKRERMIEEDIYLKMKYDVKGVNKTRVNDFFSERYFSDLKIPDFIKGEYFKYPFRIKRISFALKIKINPGFYKLFLKYFKI